MLATILLVLAVVVAALLIYAAFKPNTFRLERSAVIAAPAEKIFPLINDLKGFNAWNPFATQDPAQTISYESVTAGRGAAYTWLGTKSGAGRMHITESVPSQRVLMNLDFSKPMEAHDQVVFTLAPQSAGTQVTWAMSGRMPYLHRLMSTFFSMDKMVGGEFAKGLASLKSLAEAK